MMTDLSELIAQIRELLPKVYEGQWSVEEFQQDGDIWGNIVDGDGTIIAEVRGALDSCGNGDNANWLALLNPVTVSALLDRIEELERERDNEDLPQAPWPASDWAINRIAELERERDEWRKDFGTLCKAVVGETGLSAIEEAPKLRSRAAAAESRLAEARAEALEEAAKVADGYIGMGWRGSELPESIRALKSGGANG